jgi:serine/threonine protein kinase
MAAYETAFLAIASKNKLLTQDEAAQCLVEFNQQPAGAPRRSIEQIVQDKDLLTGQQIRNLAAAAAKVAGGAGPAEGPAPGGPPSSGTTRLRAAAAGARPPSSGEHPAVARPPGPPAGAPKAPDPSEPIPGVRIAGKLGVGGTASVFLAKESATGKSLALKIIHPKLAKDEKAVRRFQREAQLLCSFEHPNLVRGHSQGLMGPLSYFLMECLEGESAQEVLDRDRKVPEARALEIVMEAAKAIEHMQSKGFVHRDIKPGNLFLCRDGGVKVIDLGFAQPMDGSGDAGDEETTSGTVQYMSPEQARGQRDLDVRADIYSLGATLYHLVMGELPFTGGDSLEVMAKQVMEALNSGNMKNQRISRHMHYFIERMMSKDKDLRYSTPRELIDDINEQIEGFKSLEYRPDEGDEGKSNVKSIVERAAPPAPRPSVGKSGNRRIGPLSKPFARPPGMTTRRFSKLEEFRDRLRRK